MRGAWLLAGLAVAVPAGAILLARKKQSTAKPAAGGGQTVPASVTTPAAEPGLTPALETTMREWLDSIDVDNVGTPEHKPPTPDVIAGATGFANQLEQAGYISSANALRTAIQIASTSVQASPKVAA